MINNIYNRRTATSLLKFTYRKYINKNNNKTINSTMSNLSNSSLLQTVRDHFNTLNIDAFIIGSGDAHQSEYVHQCDMRRAFISNFHGSAGTALITKDKALLWTDGRYFLQASNELSEEWTLMKSGEPQVLEINDWIKENLSEGSIVGVDAFLMTASQAKLLQSIITPKKIKLKSVEFNPIDAVWDNRPASPKGIVEIHDLRLAGVGFDEKIKNIQSQLINDNIDAVIYSMLDEIMWALNIRGYNLYIYSCIHLSMY
jgi:Xaa-Pro aminopeptidase